MRSICFECLANQTSTSLSSWIFEPLLSSFRYKCSCMPVIFTCLELYILGRIHQFGYKSPDLDYKIMKSGIQYAVNACQNALGWFSNRVMNQFHTVGCVFPMVFSPELRMRRHSNDNHRVDASHFMFWLAPDLFEIPSEQMVTKNHYQKCFVMIRTRKKMQNK